MKQAQVTVFIMVGIVILAVFMFVFQLRDELVKADLERGKSEVFSKIFQKEALRIYVEDCLQDELEAGLVLLGRQGRIWQDQPGGSTAFLEGENGVLFEGERVAYALTKSSFDFRVYPCAFDDGGFCEYTYPNVAMRFGEMKRWEEIIEGDLEAYLKVKSQACIDAYFEQTNSGVIITGRDFTLDVGILNDGIAVEAFYPLGIQVGEDDFFHISVFDFFYPTEFRRMVKTAFLTPMEMDWRYVDYGYTEEKLKAGQTASGVTILASGNEFTRLGMSLQRSSPRTAEGDTVFTASVPYPQIVHQPGEYIFRFARQNRPPALEYVERSECPAEGYDYLIVKGSDTDGGLKIELKAVDPDDDETREDRREFSFSDFSLFGASLDTYFKKNNVPALLSEKPDTLDAPASALADLPSGDYSIMVSAQDYWEEKDEQEVNIKIDGSIDPSLATMDIVLPFPSDGNTISLEDPFYINITHPTATTAGASQTVTIGGVTFTIAPDTCPNFPNQDGECGLSHYDSTNMDYDFSTNEVYIFLSSSPTIQTDFSLAFCPGQDAITTSQTRTPTVKDCVPYDNPTHDYPFIVDTDSSLSQLYLLKNDGNTETISPFSADHACCISDGSTTRVATMADNKVCFIDETPGCFGGLEVSNINTKRGYTLENRKKLCGGDRGNVCSGDWSYEAVQESGKIKCGDFTLSNTCSNLIPTECRNKPARSSSRGQWVCYGEVGCESVCKSVFVDADDDTVYGTAGDSCDCNRNNIGKKCDSDLDSSFDAGKICKENPQGGYACL